MEGGFSASTWKKYRERLEPVAERIANDFYEYRGPTKYDVMPVGYSMDEYFLDVWGCQWHCLAAGMQGIIEKHPLHSWEQYEGYKFPDAGACNDLSAWDQAGFEKGLAEKKAAGKFIMCGGERLWERVHFLRGYENAMLDIADGEPRLRELIGRIVDYNIECVKKYLRYSEVDCIAFQDDWGEQFRLMISPEHWREFFYPGYQRMFKSVHDAGRYVYFHTDGYLLPVVADLKRAGADVINLQSGCHTLAELYGECHGKVCVSVDIDRQQMMPFATPERMKQHIRDIYYRLDGAKGGVWVKMDVYPDTPIENIYAMCEVFDELR